jgi:hypothetical protein
MTDSELLIINTNERSMKILILKFFTKKND